MPRVLVASSVLLAVLLGSPLRLPAQGPEYIRAHYDKREYQIPDARRREALHGGLYAQGHDADLSDAHDPHAVGRAAVRRRPIPGVSRPVGRISAVRATSSSIRTFAGGGCRREISSCCGRTIPTSSGPQDVDESTDTYDTIDWLLKNVANHNGKVGHYGTSYRGWLAAAGMIDAHPALKAVSPQAPIGDTFVGDDWHHNGALFLSHTFFYMPLKGKLRAGPYKRRRRRARLRHARRLRLLPAARPAVERRCPVLQGRSSVLERDRAATARTTTSGSRSASRRT